MPDIAGSIGVCHLRTVLGYNFLMGGGNCLVLHITTNSVSWPFYFRLSQTPKVGGGLPMRVVWEAIGRFVVKSVNLDKRFATEDHCYYRYAES